MTNKNLFLSVHRAVSINIIKTKGKINASSKTQVRWIDVIVKDASNNEYEITVFLDDNVDMNSVVIIEDEEGD